MPHPPASGGVRPKKHLGQHFLHDLRTAQRITDLVAATPQDAVVEIGPGRGILTQLLLPKYPLLQIVEIDPEAAAFIRAQFAGFHPQVAEEDVLKWPIAAAVPGGAFFVSNLPYNISSPVFFRLLDHHALVRQGVFMVQKEVAQRICAGPGGKEYGILSVLLGHYFTLKYEFSVGPQVFTPPPRVQSAVMSLSPIAEAQEIDFQAFKRYVKAAFNQRRKTLRNALKPIFGDHLAALPPELEALLGQRAEQLDIPTHVAMAHALRP